MTKEEAAEIIMLGQYQECSRCNGSGYMLRSYFLKDVCSSCNGVTFTVRTGWWSAMKLLGITQTIIVTRKDVYDP